MAETPKLFALCNLKYDDSRNLVSTVEYYSVYNVYQFINQNILNLAIRLYLLRQMIKIVELGEYDDKMMKMKELE